MKSLSKAGLLLSFSIAILSANTFAQGDAKGWHLKDKGTSGYYGISVDKAYEFLRAKNAKSKTILVAVIDSGIDTLHEDLKGILWVNPKEIPGNGIDDDKNGYIDDIHGWNFLGGKDGRNVTEDSYEAARVYHAFRSKYEGKDVNGLSPAEAEEYKSWKKAKERVAGSAGDVDVVMLRRFYESMKKSNEILKKSIGKEEFTGTELDAFKPATPEEKKARDAMLNPMKSNDMMDQTNTQFMNGFEEFLTGEEKKASAVNTPPKNYRGDIVGDDETDVNDRKYGNNDIMSTTSMHGTHVSGIIGAKRNNGKGSDGVADNVRIMMLRAVPDGDEHDKDIANAIRYAVDNGAMIINMSFGKEFSPQKKWVDDAVRYAESKGVLLVHAAGNDSKDVDTEDNFPCAGMKDGGRASNWITVGASGDPKLGGLTASFSNYGAKEVDVFAPGVAIYATIPGGNTYGNLQGTSMAAPVVAGVAALVLSYYPDLSAAQLKYVIEKSARAPEFKVRKPGTDETVNLSEISRTGGIINALDAIKLASTLKGERNKKALPKPKPKLKPGKKN